MSLQFIIDGYNTVNHPSFSRHHKKIKDNRIALLEFIKTARLCGSPKNKITIVFDGYPKTSGEKIGRENINVIFSREETADEKIKKIVENSNEPKRIIVVSDDKEIRFAVRPVGAKVISVEEFINPTHLQSGRNIRRGQAIKEREGLLEPELNYSQRHKINEELKKIWLK